MKNVWLFLIAILSCQLLCAEELFIKAVQAPLRADANPTAAIVTSLKQGDKVNKLSQKGLWVEVQKSEFKGWVPSLMLSSQLIEGKDNSLLQGESLEQKARRRASVSTSAGAARGLQASDKNTLVRLDKADYKQLAKYFQLYVSPAQASEFIK